jgi:hypothetical protein
MKTPKLQQQLDSKSIKTFIVSLSLWGAASRPREETISEGIHSGRADNKLAYETRPMQKIGYVQLLYLLGYEADKQLFAACSQSGFLFSLYLRP